MKITNIIYFFIQLYHNGKFNYPTGAFDTQSLQHFIMNNQEKRKEIRLLL